MFFNKDPTTVLSFVVTGLGNKFIPQPGSRLWSEPVAGHLKKNAQEIFLPRRFSGAVLRDDHEKKICTFFHFALKPLTGLVI